MRNVRWNGCVKLGSPGDLRECQQPELTRRTGSWVQRGEVACSSSLHMQGILKEPLNATGMKDKTKEAE